MFRQFGRDDLSEVCLIRPHVHSPPLVRLALGRSYERNFLQATSEIALTEQNGTAINLYSVATSSSSFELAILVVCELEEQATLATLNGSVESLLVCQFP
jgi:hypothetical protein